MSSVMAMPDRISYNITISNKYVKIQQIADDKQFLNSVVEINFEDKTANVEFFEEHKDGTKEIRVTSSMHFLEGGGNLTFSEVISSVIKAAAERTMEEITEDTQDLFYVARTMFCIAKEFTNSLIEITGMTVSDVTKGDQIAGLN